MLVSAQEEEPPIVLDQLQIDLWPEYDQPGMLVVYRIVLGSEVSLPAQINLRIPATVREPHAVAVRDVGGAPFNVQYDVNIQGEWAYVSFTATLPGVQVEYYDPSLQITGTERSYIYTWPGDYRVNQAVVLVQRPLGVASVTTNPPMGQVTTDADGLSYYGTEFGPVTAGDPFEISISYDKATDGLTKEFTTVQPNAPITDTTPGRVAIPDLTYWMVGIAAVFVIVGGGFLWYNNRQSSYAKAALKGKRRTRKKSTVSDDGAFCHDCGQRASGSDRFCRNCGTQLRHG